jgi:hypothetical protein
VPVFERFVALPKVDQPSQLVQDCRQLLSLDSGSLAEVKVAKNDWPNSIASLHPSLVLVHQRTVLLVFDSHVTTGSHCYAVSSGDQPTDLDHIRVMSSPYPGLNEVKWQN